MLDRNYLQAGMAAIALAILHPFYWFIEIGLLEMGNAPESLANGFSAWDIVFVVLGLLTIYFYISLRGILHDHHDYHKLDVIIACQIGVCVFYFLGTLAFDVAAPFMNMEIARAGVTIITVAAIVLFGVLDILIGGLLLSDANSRPDLLRVFAITTLIMGVMEVTIVFSIVGLMIFPLTVILLAVYFLRRPEMVEIV